MIRASTEVVKRHGAGRIYTRTQFVHKRIHNPNTLRAAPLQTPYMRQPFTRALPLRHTGRTPPHPKSSLAAEMETERKVGFHCMPAQKKQRW